MWVAFSYNFHYRFKHDCKDCVIKKVLAYEKRYPARRRPKIWYLFKLGKKYKIEEMYKIYPGEDGNIELVSLGEFDDYVWYKYNEFVRQATKYGHSIKYQNVW